MSTLATDTPRAYENMGGDPVYNELPIIASDTIYLGAAVGESSSAGTARPLVAGDGFMGFCVEQCANESGAAAAKQVKLRVKGAVWLTVTGVSNINVYGDAIYASDDATFTTSSTSNSQIGKLLRYDANRTNKALVYFEAAPIRSI